MVQGCENAKPALRRAPQVSYRHADPEEVLCEPGTLAVFGFGTGAPRSEDPRWLGVDLEGFDAPVPLEVWRVDGQVSQGREGELQWSAGGGWLFAAITLDEHEHGGPRDTAHEAYAQLCRFLATRRERHVQRLWNYLGEINQGEGDVERYKQFCDGRAAGMGEVFAEGFPAATAIGHHASTPRLQVYLLACEEPGLRVENPRQVSAWRYPRQYGRTPPSFARAMLLPAGDAQYGRTPPSFARAMLLPAGDALAISGTAAVVGHASAHEDDLLAQLGETLTNLEALLQSAGMAAGFDTQSPLKAYVRQPTDAPLVRDFLQHRLPGVPVLWLHGDICRQELLVEIDGWRYA